MARERSGLASRATTRSATAGVSRWGHPEARLGVEHRLRRTPGSLPTTWPTAPKAQALVSAMRLGLLRNDNDPE
jgi:hypothetical protein